MWHLWRCNLLLKGKKVVSNIGSAVTGKAMQPQKNFSFLAISH
jgi:hypothetical protein